MSAYTDAQKIANYLGTTLTSAQQTQAGVMSDAATAWIDRYLGRSWQATSPVTDEKHSIIGDRVYLTHRPVVAVSSVKTRGIYEGATVTTLSATQYELLDTVNGVLLLDGWSSGDDLALTTYTHSVSNAPADVQLAASMIAAGWLAGSMSPGTLGAESISVGQNDINIKFGTRRGDVPAEALSILNGYKVVVIA
jgi:hypothetical protein